MLFDGVVLYESCPYEQGLNNKNDILNIFLKQSLQ